MTPCGNECPAVRGLRCDRPQGHRDAHARRVTLPDGRTVRIEWAVVDAKPLAHPFPLKQ